MQKEDLLTSPEIRRIHFIGIGGISMSGLAEILLSQGYVITGSDMKSSAMTEKLEKMGIGVIIGHAPENIKGSDLVVYTAAVRESNPELSAARAAGIICIDRATLLGLIMKQYSYGLTVSGTHGKTTTTSMISMILLEANLDPTIHIGGELPAIGGTTRIGGSRYFVAEACEYTESFLKFYPYLAVILNIEFDHADYFRDMDHVREAFLKFMRLVPEHGFVVANADDENVMELAGKLDCSIVTYGLKAAEAEWSATNITFDEAGRASYMLTRCGQDVVQIKLGIPGMHNVSNSLAAIAACYTFGCGLDRIASSLEQFTGTHRRFELKGKARGVQVIDDYAHHPSEVVATLKAAVNCAHNRIWCVFQPHTYTRTKALLDEFSTSFDHADKILLADIYAAREQDPGDIHSGMLADRLGSMGKDALHIKGFDAIVQYLKENVKAGDLVITMGAGDIYKVGEMFLRDNGK